jgi:photosystem II stability/assembly factor-like uncharacterized protein
MKPLKQHCVLLFALLTLLACQFVFVEDGYPHSPHDVIDSLEVSPDYEHDKTIFIIISDHLRKSNDSGYSWKELVNGLDHKQLLTSIAISPSYGSDQTVFVSSDGDGIYRSNNGGKSWEKVNRGLNSQNIRHVFISPSNYDGTVIAADTRSGLYRTKNGGEQWHKVIDEAKITSLSFYPGPDNGNVFAGDSRGNLYHSADMGATWKIIFKDGTWGAINTIAIALGDDDNPIIFVGTEKSSVFKSIDGGASFVALSKGIPDGVNIQCLAIADDYKNSPIIFASTWHEAVFRSNDGGDTWKVYDQGLTRSHQADTEKYHSPHFRSVRIVKTSDKEKTVFLAGFDGLFKSVNGGQNWFEMETLPVSLIKAMAVSPGSRKYAVAITTYGGGAYLSPDKGNSWFICNKGLKTTRLSDIVFSYDYPSDKTLYSASIGILLKSTDAGYSWKKIMLKPQNWRHKAYAIARRLKVPRSWRNKILNRSARRKKWPTVITLSPGNEASQELYFATRYQGVFRLEHGGENHTLIWDGQGRTITSMVISPDFDRDATLFASVRGLGIYKTQDKGKNWLPVNSGLTFLNEWQKSDTIHQIFKKDVKLAISPSYATDKTVLAGSSEGFFKTTNGGAKWVNLHDINLTKHDYIIGLGISPNFQSDNTVFVSVRGKGLLKSENGGLSFQKIAAELLRANHAIEFIEFSPNYTQDRTIYAASDEALFKSTDGGIHWEIVKRPVRYENHREIFQYSGKWAIEKKDDYSASTISVSDDNSAKATLNFVGRGVVLIGPKIRNLGIAKIFIDGKFIADVDQFSDHPVSMTELYTIEELSFGFHTITFKSNGTKNPASNSTRIAIDAIDVLP